VPAAPVSADAAGVDEPTFLESNFIGRSDSKVSALACTPSGDAVIVQIRQPLEDHGHGDADEFVYVIAGEGSARLSEEDRPLKAGVFVMIPRGMRHGFTARGRNPLIFLSIKSASGPQSCRS
jgi:mannose-6-phosphate isomerase-like protein (cupin superfamily)